MKLRTAALCASAALGLWGCGENEQTLLATPTTTPRAVSWAEVRPILESHCTKCHASYLDRTEAIRASGEMVGYLKDGAMPVVGSVEPLNKTDWNTLLTWAQGDRK